MQGFTGYVGKTETLKNLQLHMPVETSHLFLWQGSCCMDCYRVFCSCICSYALIVIIGWHCTELCGSVLYCAGFLHSSRMSNLSLICSARKSGWAFYNRELIQVLPITMQYSYTTVHCCGGSVF